MDVNVRLRITVATLLVLLLAIISLVLGILYTLRNDVSALKRDILTNSALDAKFERKIVDQLKPSPTATPAVSLKAPIKKIK